MSAEDLFDAAHGGRRRGGGGRRRASALTAHVDDQPKRVAERDDLRGREALEVEDQPGPRLVELGDPRPLKQTVADRQLGRYGRRQSGVEEIKVDAGRQASRGIGGEGFFFPADLTVEVDDDTRVVGEGPGFDLGDDGKLRPGRPFDLGRERGGTGKRDRRQRPKERPSCEPDQRRTTNRRSPCGSTSNPWAASQACAAALPSAGKKNP